MLHGRRARDHVFLERFAGISPDVARHPANGAAARRDLLVFAAWVQVMARFERSLYADPGQDLVATWWNQVERYQRLRRPDGIGPGDWAAKIHLTVAPVYYHNYLLGQMTASQLEATLARELGTGSPAAEPGRGRRPAPRAVPAPGREAALGRARRVRHGLAAHHRGVRGRAGLALAG